MIKVSIIVPIYNASNYLETCINSLLNQTLDDYEIILINDGSTDNSKEIIAYYEENYKKIKAFNKENGGQSSARNLGLAKAKGEYISFIDADDYIENTFLEKLYKNALENNSDISFCNYYFVNEKITKHKDYVINNYNHVTNNEYLLTDPAPWNKLFKKSFLNKINFKFIEGIIYEDLASIFSLAKYNIKISYVNECLYYYVKSGESTMRKKEYNSKYEDIFTSIKYLNNNLKNTNCLEELEYITTYHLLFLASLNFYKYNKFNMIDKISIYMHNNYKNFNKNKYYKKLSLKEKTLCYLFYQRKYKIIKLIQKIKR